MVHLLLAMGWLSRDLRPIREEGPVDAPLLARAIQRYNQGLDARGMVRMLERDLFDLLDHTEVNTRSGQRIWVNVSALVHEDPKSGIRGDLGRFAAAGPGEPAVGAGASGAPPFRRREEPGRHRA